MRRFLKPEFCSHEAQEKMQTRIQQEAEGVGTDSIRDRVGPFLLPHYNFQVGVTEADAGSADGNSLSR